MADIICALCGNSFPQTDYDHLKCPHCLKVVDVEQCRRLQAKAIHWQVRLYGGDVRQFDHLPSIGEIMAAFNGRLCADDIERHIQSFFSYVEDE